jgi:hypothetical protein
MGDRERERKRKEQLGDRGEKTKRKERKQNDTRKKKDIDVAKVMLHNVAGLANKIVALKTRLKDKEIDFCLLTEPLLKTGITDIEEYTVNSSQEKSPGENSHSQVACLAWDRTTHPTTPLEFTAKHRGVHWNCLVDPGVAMAVVYVPPDCQKSDEYVRELYLTLESNIAEIGRGDFLLAGDFNVPFKNKGIWPEGRNSEALRKLLKSQMNLEIVNWTPFAQGRFETRQRGTSQSQLDLVIASGSVIPKIKYFKTTTENLGSDHYIIEFGIQASGRTHQKEGGSQTKIKYDWNEKGAKTAYEQGLKDPLAQWTEKWQYESRWLDPNGAANRQATQQATTELSDILIAVAGRTALSSKGGSNQKKRGKKIEDWEERLKEATKDRRTKLKALVAGEKSGHDTTKLKKDFLKAKDKVDKFLEHRRTNSNRQTWESVETKFDSKQGGTFWTDIKSAIDKPRKELPKSLIQDGNVTWKAESIKKAWKRRFELEEKTESEDKEERELKHKVQQENRDHKHDYRYEQDVENKDITLEELEEALKRAKRKKSPGMDMVVNEMILFGGQIAVTALFKLLSMLWRVEKIPNSWRNTVVTPVHKKNSAFDTNNYRPITLMSHLMKLYERILDNRIRCKIKIPQEQSGYRKGHGAMRQLLRLQQVIIFQHAKNSETYIAFLDLRQAYDRTWREGMFYRLWEAGIRGKCWRVIVDFYENNRACVNTNYGRSAGYAVKIGVLQGSVLSPILFLIFINPVIEKVKELGLDIGGMLIAALLFCDDICIVATTQEQRTLILAAVTNFLKLWRTEVNATKSHLVSPPGSATDDVVINGQHFKHKMAATYLGIEVDGVRVLTRKHVLRKLAKGRAMLKRLSSIGIKPGQLRPDITAQLIVALVNSKVTYGFELLNQDSSRMALLDQTQLQIGAEVLGLPTTTPTGVILAEMGLPPMHYRAARAVLILANKIQRDSDDYLSNHLIMENAKLGVGFYVQVQEAARLINFKDLNVLRRLKPSYLASYLKRQLSLTQQAEWILQPQTHLVGASKPTWGLEPGMLIKSLAFNTAQLIKFRCNQTDLRHRDICRWCNTNTETPQHVTLECIRWLVDRTEMWDKLRSEVPQLYQLHTKPAKEILPALLGGFRQRLSAVDYINGQRIVSKFITAITQSMLHIDNGQVR